MFANGNSYGTSNAMDLGGSCANDLGWSLLLPTPRWFLPVMVWHPRPGK